MSSARHTPRYTPLISAEPTGPQLVGPEEAVRRPKLMGPHPIVRDEPRTRHTTEVIPLRPPAPAISPEESAARATRRRKLKPVGMRPWKVLIVPVSPGASTRSFDVARWQARWVMAALSVTVLLAAGAVTAIVTAIRSPELVVLGDEALMLRARLNAVEDSLAEAQDHIAAREEADAAAAAEADSLAALMKITVPTTWTGAPAAPSARRPNFSRRLRGTSSGTYVSSAGMGLPTIGILASQFSRSRRHPILHIMRPHLGLDIAAPRGTVVRAPAPGRVVFVGRSLAFGLSVEIMHAEGVKSRYGHLSSANVQVGEPVLRGMRIAAVGSSGLSTGPHLHYEVLINGHQVNPLHFRYAANEAAASAAATAGVSDGATEPATMAGAPAESSPAPVSHSRR